jgi:hypothetical protein
MEFVSFFVSLGAMSYSVDSSKSFRIIFCLRCGSGPIITLNVAVRMCFRIVDKMTLRLTLQRIAIFVYEPNNGFIMIGSENSF